jgi:predicted ATPase
MKLEIFCKAKDILEKTNQKPANWEKKIFTNYTSNRGLISKIYKELKKIITEKPNSPI